MTKDPHPDPPLRALPEHSILGNEPATQHPGGLSGGASPHGLDGTANQTSISQLNTVTGTSKVDFAQSMGTSTETRTESSEQKIQSGSMTFKLPDFKQEDTSVLAAREDVLSPTQPQEEQPAPDTAAS
jgi:glycogenin glucosyltransferase